ncbi:MAG: DUF6707 family protein [Actinomycetales bacterium]
MTEPTQAQFFGTPAARIEPGHTLMSPAGSPVTVVSVDWEHDDFGNQAIAVVSYDGGTLRISAAAAVQVAGAQTIPAVEGTPEAVTAAAAAAHGGHETIQRLAARLAGGLNTKSGAQLRDVSQLARVLFVQLGDAAHALSVAHLVTELPYDGNPGRWTPVEQCLAIAHYVAVISGNEAEADRTSARLRAPDDTETDPFRAKMAAVVRQRSLNEPNLYDKEITRSAAAGDKRAELDWRALRLETLLRLLAHGGSETFDAGELQRRISNELAELRNPAAG